MKSSLLILLCIIGVCLAAPLLTTIAPTETQPTQQLIAPNAQHWFGTDYLGRDVYSRTLYGGRRTLAVSTLATVFAVSVGIMWGMLGTLASRPVRALVVALIDAWLALPGLIIALVLLLFLGRGAVPIAIAVGLAQMAGVARIVRSRLLQVLQAGYIDAAHSLGASQWHIIWHHLLPNISATLLTYTAIVFSYSIINSAALSLLGLGQDPAYPDWGIMLAEGRNSFRIAPWVAIAPGLAISLTIISVHRLVDQWGYV